MNDLELEFVWRPSAAMGNQTQIFTHVLYNMYSSPQGFDFDIITDYPFCDWINDESTRDYNAPNEAENLIPLLEERISHYATDEILLLFGGDFEFYNAYNNYKQMDAMIEYMNKHYSDKYIFKYSTPSDYVAAIAKHNVPWSTKYDDMFPYSDSPDSYWTGFFSSRANDKEYIRRASHNFHAST
jgi:lysosomal alpha-mannosidase